MAAINAALTTPVATGERITRLADFRDLFNARACEVCQLDLTHVGGFSEARRVAEKRLQVPGLRPAEERAHVPRRVAGRLRPRCRKKTRSVLFHRSLLLDLSIAASRWFELSAPGPTFNAEDLF